MKLVSIINQLRCLFAPRPLPLQKPTVIQFPVIDICNSKCQMCRIWENKKSTDITVMQLRKGLASELFSEVEGIGFNGGEPTLREDLHELVEVVVASLPKLKHVSLITNAYKYIQVIEKIKTIAPILREKNIKFDVMVSLDGFEKIHDLVRGRSGNFANAQKVIDFIIEYPLVDNVRIGCTVIRENVFHLPDLLEFCIRKGVYIKFRQGVPHQRLYTANLLDPYALTFEEKYEFVEFLEGVIKFYETDSMQRLFYRSLINQIILDKPRGAGCDWKHRGATITAKGELAYCAVQSKVLMKDISEGDPLKVFFDNKDHLKEIIQTKCDSCHHDYVGIPDKKLYRSIFIERLEEKFKIKLKDKAKKIPGFNFLNELRHKMQFAKNLKYYLSIEEQPTIKLKIGKRVLICGWYGTETLGDKGIIAGVMHCLREYLGEDTQFIVVSLFPYVSQMTRIQMPEFHNTHIVTPEGGASMAANMDYVVFGGGPIMGINSLAPIEAIFKRAKSAGTKTILAGCGVGPYGSKWHNRSMASILGLSDIRIYRDKRSKDYASELGIDTQEDVVAEDPAFTWLSTIQPSLHTENDDRSKKILLLGLRDFPYKEYARDLSENECIAIKNNYEKTIVDALKQLIAKDPSLVIRPLPMCTNHFGSDDRWFYRKLFRGHEDIMASTDESLLGPEMSPIEYCNAFSTADALLGMRFHSLVFSLGLGTNSVALDYTLGKGKVCSLAEKYGVELISMITMDADQLVTTLEKALKSPKPLPLSKDILTFSTLLKNKLNKN